MIVWYDFDMGKTYNCKTVSKIMRHFHNIVKYPSPAMIQIRLSNYSLWKDITSIDSKCWLLFHPVYQYTIKKRQLLQLNSGVRDFWNQLYHKSHTALSEDIQQISSIVTGLSPIGDKGSPPLAKYLLSPFQENSPLH